MTMTTTLLNLHRLIPIRDVRKKVWGYLNWVDIKMCWCAHNKGSIHYPDTCQESILEFSLVHHQYLEVAKWTYVNCPFISVHDRVYSAARNPKFVYWLLKEQCHVERGMKWIRFIHLEVVQNGLLDTMKVLHSVRGELDLRVYFRGALQFNQINVLEWLLKIGYQPYESEFNVLYSQNGRSDAFINTLTKFKVKSDSGCNLM